MSISDVAVEYDVPVMDEARLTVSQWVYLSRLPGDGGVLVEPAGAL